MADEPVLMYEIHLLRYDVPNSSGQKWRVTMIDNTTKDPAERTVATTAGDDIGAMDLLRAFMRMRE